MQYCILAALALVPLYASEHHGIVKFGGLPVPGASVTATQGERRLSTITDPDGVYSFADLADGAWTIQVDMQLFAVQKREIMAPANGIEWELNLLTEDQIQVAIAPA